MRSDVRAGACMVVAAVDRTLHLHAKRFYGMTRHSGYEMGQAGVETSRGEFPASRTAPDSSSHVLLPSRCFTSGRDQQVAMLHVNKQL